MHKKNLFLINPKNQLIKKTHKKLDNRPKHKTADEDPLSLYLKQISQYSLLTLDEEQQIGEHIQKLRMELAGLHKRAEKNSPSCIQTEKEIIHKEDELRSQKNRMINSNLRLVVSIAKKYQHRGLSLLDLIDEGNIGLIEAVERFDYKKGCRFSTYGTWWIRQAIIKSLADKGRVIRIPIHMLNTIKKCYFIAKNLTQELGRDPNDEEISAYMNIPKEKISTILQLTQETASLDTTVDDDNQTRLSDLIRDDGNAEPFESVFHLTIQDTLTEVLKQLSEREMKIIQLRFGLEGEGPLTLEETGKLLGITRERVRQIQEKALAKLKLFSRIQDFHRYY